MKSYTTHTTQKQFFLFLLVGSLNTLVGYGLYALFICFNLHYTLAIFLSTCLGVLFSFQTTGRIVFQNKEKKLLIQFIRLYAFLYCINVLLVGFFHQYLDNLYVVGALVSILMAGLSFYMNKRFVFNKLPMSL
jgi:putative flippase GtrA